MAQPLYSTRFADVQTDGGPPSVLPAVPTGVVQVLRTLTVVTFSGIAESLAFGFFNGDGSQISVGQFYPPGAPSGDPGEQFEGRVVIVTGEAWWVQSISGPTYWTLNGYTLAVP